MPPPRTSPTTMTPTPHWPKALGLSAAVGYSLAWAAAAARLSDLLLAAALACEAVTLLVLFTGRRAARWVALAAAGSSLLGVIVVGACWTRQATDYIHHDIRFCKVGFAFWHYAYEHGDRFPPAASHRPDGTPLLSWRVHLLPYIEQADLYKEFRLDEPWDSPHNLALLPRMPDDYRPLLARGAEPDPPGTTRCQVVVGPGTAFDGPAGLSPATDFPDGVSQTLLFIEARTPVPWTKPDDVRYDPAGPMPAFGPEVPDTLCGLVFGAGRPRQAMYMLADGGTGSVGRLDPAWDDGDLRRLIERNNGTPGRR